MSVPGERRIARLKSADLLRDARQWLLLVRDATAADHNDWLAMAVGGHTQTTTQSATC